MCPQIAAVIALISYGLFASAGVYRWTDANGKVHFGDRPPAEAKTEQVNITPGEKWRGFDIRLTFSDALLKKTKQQPPLDAQRIERDVNRVYRFYDQKLYVDFYRKVPVSIHVVADLSEYRRYLELHVEGSVPPSLGVYLSKQHQIVVFIHPDRLGGVESTYRTIKHETSHAILHSIAEVMPAWLNEGLAEQMETLEEDAQQRFVITRHNGNRQHLMNQSQLMPVKQFVELNNSAWSEQNSGKAVHQAMAGQLVYLCLSKSYGRGFITRLVHEYKRGYRYAAYHLLDEHYVGGGSALTLHWQDWRTSGMNAPLTIVFD